ncbi:uncharacterized protein I206_103035 [Kwoniella pini CBS 10737]|uniref:Uncharacterized protein n=1 Tax=Kwoniella pini CBS 10737 TaxID=1296096 RepID=A0A1B9IB91_9TREE|nr:uncharacterized protein I206_01960 [Kwoniella pini CBS 10737]OCF52667.1 hypothetical protein I206_01960 [Kwoniella pini CBS 10737]
MSLSRLQLAAALMEYDNDSDLASPNTQETFYKDHRASAIFQPFNKAQAEARRHKILSQPPPSLPSPLGESSRALNDQRRQSTSELNDHVDRPKSQNQSFRQSTISDFRVTPAGGRSINLTTNDIEEEEHLKNGEKHDVDVERWGLPSHLVLDESNQKPKLDTRKSVNSIVPKPEASSIGSRIKSIHVEDVLDDTDLHKQIYEQSGYIPFEQRQEQRESNRRKRNHSYDFSTSTANALSSGAQIRELIENQRERPSTVMGFTSKNHERDRKLSDPRMIPLPNTPGSLFNSRTLSSGSGWNSPPPGKMDEDLENQDIVNDEPNPFALPAPPPELGSRFDPKILQTQRQPSFDQDKRSYSRSSGIILNDHQQPPYTSRSRSTFYPQEEEYDDTEYIEPNPLVSPSFKVPNKVWEDIPTPEQYGRPLKPHKYRNNPPKPLDRLTMLRPKTLIMPSSLANRYSPPPPQIKLPEGYTLGEKPLPPGAKTQGERPKSGFNHLSISQRTFRSSLMVNGLHDEEFVGGATEDGEMGIKGRDLDVGALERRPGKLFGRSLMDELEARKSAQKGKQRVFTGDSRPAMMARSSMFEPPTISLSPTSPPLPGSANSNRPQSMHPIGNRAPLLSFDSKGDIHPTSPDNLGIPDQGGRISKSKSVFGVDQIWEKELAKLKLIQEEDRRIAEFQKMEEEEKELKKMKRKSKKGKGKEILPDLKIPKESVEEPSDISPIARAADLPPALQYSPEKAPSRRLSQEEGEDVEESRQGGVGSYDDGNGEEVNAPHDFVGTLNRSIRDENTDEDDSEEDIPLSKLALVKSRLSASTRNSILILKEPESEDDSDEDIPLSRLPIAPKSPSIITRTRKPLKSLELNLPSSSSSSNLSKSISGKSPMSAEVDDENAEDDLPLAVRQAKTKGLKPITKAEIIEDDLPLGYKHSEKAQAQMQMQIQMQMQMQMVQRQFEEENINRQSMINPYQSWMIPNMNIGMVPPQFNINDPYVGMGFTPSIPNLGINLPINMNMGMGIGMGNPQINMNMGGFVQPNQGNPGEAIDHWRNDVALAPVGTSDRDSRISGFSSAGREGSIRT